ncbi:unnamed protein product, partial [Polarella glacialis]
AQVLYTAGGKPPDSHRSSAAAELRYTGSSAMAISNKKLQKIMTLPINQIFRYLQNRSRVQVWLHEQSDLRIEGRILGFDEYMNLVIDDAEEIMVKKKTRRAIGRILLKGDNICLMMNTGA